MEFWSNLESVGTLNYILNNTQTCNRHPASGVGADHQGAWARGQVYWPGNSEAWFSTLLHLKRGLGIYEGPGNIESCATTTMFVFRSHRPQGDPEQSRLPGQTPFRHDNKSRVYCTPFNKFAYILHLTTQVPTIYSIKRWRSTMLHSTKARQGMARQSWQGMVIALIYQPINYEDNWTDYSQCTMYMYTNYNTGNTS